jgi:hypothetical protein
MKQIILTPGAKHIEKPPLDHRMHSEMNLALKHIVYAVILSHETDCKWAAVILTPETQCAA